MMNSLLEEYIFEYEVFTANMELHEKIFQLECCSIHESTGLISLQESIVDTIAEWFTKIMKAIDGIIEKLETKLAELYEKQLAKYKPLMDSANRMDPQVLNIPITNYHEYDFTKFRDGSYEIQKSFTNPEFANVIAGLVSGGTGQKPEAITKTQILQKLYPDLYDENLSVFDKMRENMLTTGKDNDEQTILTNDMLDNAWNYVSEDYIPFIRAIKQDRDQIKAQKKNVDAAAQQLANAFQNREPTPNRENPTPNTTPAPAVSNQQESFVFCEGYILEADQKEKDVKNQKVGGEGETGVSREMFAKLLTTYIQVATDLVSAKTKMVNTVFMDKFRIVRYYCKKVK